jgi:hypothetical protein
MVNLKENAARAGYLLGGGLAAVRVAGAKTVQDLVLAGALTAAEFGAIRFVERKAEWLSQERGNWDADQKTRGQALDQVGAADDENRRRQQVLGETIAEIAAIDAAAEHDHLMSDQKTLTTIAVNSVRSGYHAGVAYIRGKLSGV